MSDARWQVHRYRFDLPVGDLSLVLADRSESLSELIKALGGRDGQRFLLGPNGFPDTRVNDFLGSARMRNLAETSNRDYAGCLALWLNFLATRGQEWFPASVDDVEEFQFLRLTDPTIPERVGTSTFSKDIAACKKFYRWASSRYPEVADIFAEVGSPRAKRTAGVKWLDPAAIARWRDVGLRGRTLDGGPDKSWRGRNEQRDSAFVDGLYGTGLRLTEWGSVVLPELPTLELGRSFYTCRLADKCAKGGYGHPYWMPVDVLRAVRAYIEGPRARAVRDAQAEHRYDAVAARQIAQPAKRGGHVILIADDGQEVQRPWNLIDPEQRRRLFMRTGSDLEPLALWLNEDGLPRDPHGWHHTFDNANRRIAALGLPNFRCTPHMHRHSFALKWFSIGKLVYAARLSSLEEDGTNDFRTQFGDTWHFVQTMLGHARVETTKNVYLEPFRNLDVEILLAHADGFPVKEFLSQAFRLHPNVASDPVGTSW
ncbi:site-specific integrase [Mycobacteroides abscessus]|uniref:site-specific integrase n=1 Tax=Mycobacteroides abscessus TaxID=36809 RepID=UPI001F39D185|nr:site-specific integrase [Mycobacteroides abscessus]